MAGIERTKEMIEIMQAYVDGKPIEFRDNSRVWMYVQSPVWDWNAYDYRIAQIPDSIDWSHVNPEFKFMARSVTGEVFLFRSKPIVVYGHYWAVRDSSISCNAKNLASYKQGTVDWKDSLVERPD